ncbi:hypothetical protein CAPTEDRAFT_223345 [Capitella teleta]|uniref:Flavin reductase like domain-containing protein n=1 Tax=Capitella teleta TaxID=283909 RepID=R7TAB8_CAPTE|nr:hypothetical protein CAPTEDRAFT_223345 [Capitella teleta]|eukprot:ELT87959.1 hypothetical protein CAPTEDRAFT_223345 [Capitella teleta]
MLKYARVLRGATCCRVRQWRQGSSASEREDTEGKGHLQATVLKRIMNRVPQPVVVVTAAKKLSDGSGWYKRGVTCSSFTGISLCPPIVSVAFNIPSRMHDLMLETERFAVHVLAKNQVRYGLHFAKRDSGDNSQFADIPHEMDPRDMPILRDTTAVMLCTKHSVHSIGDHNVWYGQVEHAYNNSCVQERREPLLYYARSFRAIGDEAFMKAFEDTTLPFEDWTHEAHIRMAFHYIRDLGPEAAVDHIKNGIKKFNAQNKDKINRGYHETVTTFYTQIIAEAMKGGDCEDLTFDEFIEREPWIMDRHLLFEYYSDERINDSRTKSEFLSPDKKPISRPGS